MGGRRRSGKFESVERTATAAFTVKCLWLRVGHYKASFVGLVGVVISGAFPVGMATGQC